MSKTIEVIHHLLPENDSIDWNVLPCTTTLKSRSCSPAAFVATHWNRAASESWARDTISRRPLVATRKPSLCLTGFPSLYHLENYKFCTESVCALMCVYLCVCMRCRSYVMTGGGVPVASHSSSKGLLSITVLSVTSSAPSRKGGTGRGNISKSAIMETTINTCSILKWIVFRLKTHKPCQNMVYSINVLLC